MDIRKLATFSGFVWAVFPANASSSDNWENFSDIGAYGLTGVAMALPAYKRDWGGFKQAGYSIVAASGVGLLGKSLIEEERPDHSGNDSFPSNHTANAFAAATTLNLRYGWEVGFPAYGIAALVGVGRVQSEKHHWKDVLGGAVIGSMAGWVFTDASNEKIKIVPWAGRNEGGLSVSLNW